MSATNPTILTPASATRSGEPRLAGAVSWLVLGASFGLSASTWVALAELAGFTATYTLPAGVVARLAWLMPLAVDGYVVVALVMWMAPVPLRVARFARTNTYAAAAIGVLAQSCYHALVTWSVTGVPWRAGLAAVVGALPPAVAGLAVHMRALTRRESGATPTVKITPGEGGAVEPVAPPAAPTPTVKITPGEGGAVEPVAPPAAPTPTVKITPGEGGAVEPVAPPAAPTPTVKITPRRGKAPKRRPPTTAERVARAVARTPNATNVAIAERLGLAAGVVGYHRRGNSKPPTSPSPAEPEDARIPV
jgi:hypothetical protein